MKPLRKLPKNIQDCKGPTDGRIFIKKETYQMTTYRINYSIYGNIKDLNPGTLKPKNKVFTIEFRQTPVSLFDCNKKSFLMSSVLGKFPCNNLKLGKFHFCTFPGVSSHSWLLNKSAPPPKVKTLPGYSSHFGLISPM